jgi:hypothetical protein
VNGLEPHILSATLLAGRKPLQFNQKSGRLTIQVPAKAADPNATVIELKTK